MVLEPAMVVARKVTSVCVFKGCEGRGRSGFVSVLEIVNMTLSSVLHVLRISWLKTAGQEMFTKKWLEIQTSLFPAEFLS